MYRTYKDIEMYEEIYVYVRICEDAYGDVGNYGDIGV